MKPYNKHDFILDRDLTVAERLEPQRATVRFTKRALDSLDYVLRNASNDLTEEQIQTVAAAVQYAYNAVSNAANLGTVGYHALPVQVVRWKQKES